MNKLFAGLGFAIIALAGVTSAHAEIRRQYEGATCLYDGKAYSPGAKITLQDGTVQTCQSDGTWARKVPPHDPRTDLMAKSTVGKLSVAR